MRSRLRLLKMVVKTMRSHDELILHRFKAKRLYSCGAVDRMNRTTPLVTGRTFYRSPK